MDIKKYLGEKGKMVEEALDRYLPKETEMPATLHKAMRYSMMAGGKRIRPVLCIASCEAAGGRIEEVMPVACALEMIHTYSLIHDDLPAMDNDDLRRGMPTNHKVFGEAVAILAGDALLTLAFRVMTDMRLGSMIKPSVVLDVINDMSWAAGSFGMVGGQVVDMESEGREIDLPTLEYLRRQSQIGDARVGAASDEHDVNGMAEQGLTRLESHVLERFSARRVGRR